MWKQQSAVRSYSSFRRRQIARSFSQFTAIAQTRRQFVYRSRKLKRLETAGGKISADVSWEIRGNWGDKTAVLSADMRYLCAADGWEAKLHTRRPYKHSKTNINKVCFNISILQRKVTYNIDPSYSYLLYSVSRHFEDMLCIGTILSFLLFIY